MIGTAEGVRLFQYRVEQWGEVTGGAVDDLQDLRSRGLLLERVAGLGDQPRALHRDHSLRGEILQ